MQPKVLFSSCDPTAAMDQAERILGALIDEARQNDEHPVAVFDVDETLLLNDPDEESFRVAVNPPGRRLHDWLRKRGVSIYVVTARRKTKGSRKYVDKQLHALGYPAPVKLFMVNREHDEDESASLFKLEARKRIAKGRTGGRAHRVLVNVGDQASDMMLMDPYSDLNAKFAKRHLHPTEFHLIADADGVSDLGLKLPARYVVA